MKNLTIAICIFFSFPSFSQIDIGTLSVARYGIRTAIMGDTIIFAGGDNYDSADFFTVDDGVVDVQLYGSDGFETAKVLVNDNIAFYYDLSNVGLSIREFYKYNKANNEWSDGKYNISIDEDVLFLDENLIYSFSRFDFDSISVFNIQTNDGYKIASNIDVREFGIAQNDDFVYCVGGITSNSSLSDELNVFNKTTKIWTKYSLERARREPYTLIHNNKLIINGGFNEFSKTVEIVDLTTFESVTFDLPQANREGLLVASGETLMVAGGFKNSAVTINLSTLEVGEPYVLEEEAINSGLSFLQGESLGDEIILGGDRWPRFHIYNTTTNSWNVVPMDAARRNASMFKHKNRVYFVGGRDADNNSSNAITVFDITNSISEEDLLNFNIYPNPTSDFLKIDIEKSSDIQVRIYNSKGEIVVSCRYNDQLDLSNLHTGIYYLSVSSDDKKTVFKKLIVK